MFSNELILKVTSSCNLNCEYCYVFNQGDYGYLDEPKIMSEEVMIAVINRIYEHCKAHKIDRFLIIFHGGEPLLAKKSFYSDFIHAAKEIIKNVNVEYGLQTNGTLLTQEWFSFLDNLEISVGISLDGTYEASKYRVYRTNNENAYNEIIRGINIVHNNDFPVNVLSVINTSESPAIIYKHLKDNNVKSVDFLYPDVTFDKKNFNQTEVGSWLIDMFDLWYSDNNKLYIRYFDSIIGLLVGVERGYDILGRKENKALCIKPNGKIEPIDNLKVCGDGFTKTDINVFDNTFNDAFENDTIYKYYYSHHDKVLCEQCKNCIIKDICGGGGLAHRYSTKNGFNNPSAYCKDIFLLVTHIQNRFIDDLPTDLREEINIEKLSLSDWGAN